MILEFQIIIVLPKDLPHLQSVGQRSLIVPRHQAAWNLAAQTGR